MEVRRRIAVFLSLLAGVGWYSPAASAKGGRVERPPELSKNAIIAKYKNKVAVIDTSKGRIIVEFYPKEAPKTVQNFAALADQEFYDGLIFHRVIKGFMIQGGCPRGNGTGDPGWQVDAEFNSHKHVEGTVAMARSQDPNSAGSQFYICLEPQPSLDNKYTVFGQVIKGMEVVKAIGDVETGSRDKPKDDVVILRVRVMDREKAEALGGKGEEK